MRKWEARIALYQLGDFDKTRMQAGKLERIADEIAAALDMQRQLDGDRDRLRRKLGMKSRHHPAVPTPTASNPDSAR